MSVITRTEIDRRLPEGALPVAEGGLLARVWRPCRDHGGECPCVARNADAGCLVFWCEVGEHHFTKR